MNVLATLTTAKGTKIELIAAAQGAVSVNANGKFVGMLEALTDNAAHGKVITLKGQQSIVPVGDSANLVVAAIAASKAAADKAKADADAHWAAHAQTPEGIYEAAMVRISRQEQE